MPDIRPFAAVRPVRDKAHLVATRSYVSYSRRDLREKLNGNPYTFLHVIHPDLGSRKLHKAAVDERFRLVRQRYEQYVADGILCREASPCYYLYRQEHHGHSFSGLLAAVAVDDYVSGRVRVHEHTLATREATFTHYLGTTAINAEPVLLVCPDEPAVDQVLREIANHRPEYDFTTTDRVRHMLWIISDPETIELIRARHERIPHYYIADGHHRSASSQALRDRWLAEGRISGEDHPAQAFLALIMNESEVHIHEFNRLVKDLNGLTAEQFVQALRGDFDVTPASDPFRPSSRGEMGMYLGRQWYRLRLRTDSPLLDAEILTRRVLGPVLGIGDLRRDKRISFMEGPRGLQALQAEVDRGKAAVAFALFPVSMQAMQAIADAGECMPPKSTWIEPKLRSGLVIYELQ